MSKWISLEDCLPEIGEEVLAKSSTGFIKEAVFKGNIFFVEPCFEMTDVTHWMESIGDE